MLRVCPLPVVVQTIFARKTQPAVSAFEPQFQMHLEYMSQHILSFHLGRITGHPAARHRCCVTPADTVCSQMSRELLREKDIIARLTADYPPARVRLLSARSRKIIEHGILVLREIGKSVRRFLELKGIHLGRPVLVKPGTALAVRHDLDCRS